MKNKKTLVLGASTKPDRYAYKAITMLVEKGHSVLAIGQNAGEVAGVKIQTMDDVCAAMGKRISFFEKMGYKETKKNCVHLRGQDFVNFTLKKVVE